MAARSGCCGPAVYGYRRAGAVLAERQATRPGCARTAVAAGLRADRPAVAAGLRADRPAPAADLRTDRPGPGSY
ncbi:hypothetical protein ACFW1M_42690, partial [Streptomyces inhibens]